MPGAKSTRLSFVEFEKGSAKLNSLTKLDIEKEVETKETQ
jgi:hypothetical protein